MVQAFRIDDLTENFHSQMTVDDPNNGNVVEIVGLDMLEKGMPDMLEDLCLSNDSSDSESYANDSLEMAIKKRKEMMNRSGSTNSFACDSLELAHKNNNKPFSRNFKDKSVEHVLDLKYALKLNGQHLDIKNIVQHGNVAPSLDGLKQARISNSAA
jgi:hypothetical protein